MADMEPLYFCILIAVGLSLMFIGYTMKAANKIFKIIKPAKRRRRAVA